MSMITTMININDKNSQFIFIFSKALHTYRSCSLVVYIHILYMLCVCKHQERGLLSMASAYTFTKKKTVLIVCYTGNEPRANVKFVQTKRRTRTAAALKDTDDGGGDGDQIKSHTSALCTMCRIEYRIFPL